ncbi:MAG: hypothetical protein IKK24_02460, partial [Clostridia bacterium]|nr:hypothetical protein [Clostridia bacterium]
MKGKILNFKTVLAILLLVTAGFVFAILPIAKSGKTASETFALEKVTLGQAGKEQEFSALADGDVILSVEKVKVNSNEIDYTKDGQTVGYPDDINGTNVKTFFGGHDNFISSTRNYTFLDLPNGANPKTVVEYGKFVRFDNEYKSGKYVMKDNEGYQEAVIISFGAYVQLDDKSVVTAGTEYGTPKKEACAYLTALSVEMFKNGVKQTNIPNVRNIGTAGTALYFDFVHMITQEEDNSNEGFYKLNFKYMVGGYEHTSSFE